MDSRAAEMPEEIRNGLCIPFQVCGFIPGRPVEGTERTIQQQDVPPGLFASSQDDPLRVLKELVRMGRLQGVRASSQDDPLRVLKDAFQLLSAVRPGSFIPGRPVEGTESVNPEQMNADEDRFIPGRPVEGTERRPEAGQSWR